ERRAIGGGSVTGKSDGGQKQRAQDRAGAVAYRRGSLFARFPQKQGSDEQRDDHAREPDSAKLSRRDQNIKRCDSGEKDHKQTPARDDRWRARQAPTAAIEIVGGLTGGTRDQDGESERAEEQNRGR